MEGMVSVLTKVPEQSVPENIFKVKLLLTAVAELNTILTMESLQGTKLWLHDMDNTLETVVPLELTPHRENAGSLRKKLKIKIISEVLDLLFIFRKYIKNIFKFKNVKFKQGMFCFFINSLEIECYLQANFT